MSAISCIDSVIGKASDVMKTSQAFQNPLAGGISGINNSISNVQNAVTNLSHLNVDFSGLTSCFSNIQATVSLQLDYSNFLSGISSSFPANILSSPLLAGKLPANAPLLLGGLGFAAMLGTLSGGLNSQDAMCQVDPNAPCGSISSVVSAVLGPASTILNAIQIGLDEMLAVMNAVNQAMTEVADMINQVANFINSIPDMINKIIQQIVDSINGIINSIIAMLNYELGKLLQFSFDNPCLQEFMNAIGTPTLKAALNIKP